MSMTLLVLRAGTSRLRTRKDKSQPCDTCADGSAFQSNSKCARSAAQLTAAQQHARPMHGSEPQKNKENKVFAKCFK
eukprot:scaffold355508_cov20-Prasinocladus_malaysianus.AAC.1